MIRKTTTLIAILAMVLMAPLAVQAQNEEPYESRTQPDADSTGPADGLTITGTVEEIRDGQVVINTTTGIQHVQVLPDTDMPVNLAEGQGVAIDYNRSTQGVMLATEIRLAEPGVLESETAVVETDVEREMETEVTEVEAETDEFEREVETEAAEVERDFETADTDFDTGDELETDTTTTTTTTQSQLPSTASGLPLAALLSLLILGAAIAVRTFRS